MRQIREFDSSDWDAFCGAECWVKPGEPERQPLMTEIGDWIVIADVNGFQAVSGSTSYIYPAIRLPGPLTQDVARQLLTMMPDNFDPVTYQWNRI